jgi:hypothetical protein
MRFRWLLLQPNAMDALLLLSAAQRATHGVWLAVAFAGRQLEELVYTRAPPFLPPSSFRPPRRCAVEAVAQRKASRPA